MRSFEHVNAPSLDEAVSILGDYGEKARVIAGGTDLLGTLKDGIHASYPELLLNIKTIEGLSYIKEDQEGLKIGALTRLHDIESNPTVRERYAILAQAAHTVAARQIRNMGTIAGNLCQEPRCWYYRAWDNTFHCTRKGGKVCNALTGENRYHSIFGGVRVGDTPCTEKCPGRVDIPTYVSRIREGDLPGAARILLETNPFAPITGRVCPHCCEDECNRLGFDEAVSIRSIERFMGDYILDNPNDFIRPPEIETGRHVAIVGSGPAGLSAAYYLRKMGHGVTVFDRMREAGGMLVSAIPAYRLPKELVRRQIEVIARNGVAFKLGVEIGKDVGMDDLKASHDGVFLSTGAWEQPSIGLEGEKLTKSGLEFLIHVHQGVRETPGPRVVVIGGGNVAVDVGITAKRLGAEEVTLACLERRDEMPAFAWEIEQAIQEGIRVMPSWGPSRVLESKGKVTGLELVRCTSVFDHEGNFSPAFDRAIKETVGADQIMMAVGQRVDLSYLDPGWSMKTERGSIAVDPETQQTSVPGVYAGGDMTTGPATVIEAIASGRRAALAIDRHLGDAALSRGEREEGGIVPLLKFSPDSLRRTGRTAMAERLASERRIDVEDVLGFDLSETDTEANRCFNCGCVAVSPSDLAPALTALDAKMKTTKRTVDAEAFFAAKPGKSTELDDDELVTEIQIPANQSGLKGVYTKFRLRQSIDFPIIGVAFVLRMNSNKIKEARLVLGAVAPVPLRAEEAEAFLKGKKISEEVAEAAAALAVRDVIPLTRNGYKIQVTKAFVKRSILALC